MSPSTNTRDNLGQTTSQQPKNIDIVHDGKHYVQVNVSKIIYHYSHKAFKRGALVESDANGGIGVNDVRTIRDELLTCRVSITTKSRTYQF